MHRGGRAKRANYRTVVVRVPEPVVAEVNAVIARFHSENDLYLALPTTGEWWQVLGVTPEASTTEIKKAYRKLAIVWHPDRNHLSLDARARFESVVKAYQQSRENAL
ncbi:MAG: J domain-containing protein [Nodosilinea sp.]